MSNQSTPPTPKISRSERKRQLKRNTIINMAEQFFIKNGYHNTKVDDIAYNIGYTKATVYNHFNSKEDIFAAMLSKIYDSMVESFSLYLEEVGSFDELRILGDAYLAYSNTYPDQTALVDSGICVSINQKILEKEFHGQSLTESEFAFKTSEQNLVDIMIDVIIKFLAHSGLEITPESSNLVKAMSAVNFMIREVIRRGKATKQSQDEIKEILSIIFSVIEQGVKNFV